MANDNLRNLYNTLKNSGYNPPAFDQFVKDMANEDNLRKVHATLQSEGYTPPAFDAFKADMGYTAPTSSTTEVKTEAPAATPTKPTQQQGWKPSPQQQAAFQQQMAQAQANLERMQQRTKDFSEYTQRAGFQFGRTVTSTPQWNPTSGKFETTYLTPTGERTTNKVLADFASQQYRHAADMSISGQLRKAQSRKRDIERQLAVRGEILMAEHKKNEPAGFLGFLQGMAEAGQADKMGGNTGTTPEDWIEFTQDQEYQSLSLALRTVEKQITQLSNAKDREDHGERFWHDFFRNTGQAIFNADAWDFGKHAFRDATAALKLSGRIDSGEELSDADYQAAEELYLYNNVMQDYGDLGRGARWGDISGQSISFMKDFALTGGFSGLSTSLPANVAKGVALRAATKMGADWAGKRLALQFGKEGLFATLRSGGKGTLNQLVNTMGVRGMTQAMTVKALGVAAEDLAIRAPLMTFTIQGQSTAAKVIDTKLGPVIVDEETGELRFANDKDWGEAAWEAGMDQIIENYSEMWGAHLPGLSDMTRVMGARGLTATILRSTRPGAGTILSKTSNMLSRAGVNGYFGEVGEEYYGQLWRTGLGLESASQPKFDENGNPVYKVDENGEYILDEKGNPIQERENNFKSGQFHGDIWGGMALSIGLTGGGTMALNYTGRGIGKGVNAATYSYYKHKVNVADRKASELLTPELWERTRTVIDAADNGTIGDLAEMVMADKSINDEQRAAVMDYMEQSMIFRGYNLGEILRDRAAVDPNLSVDDEDELSESYLDGYNMSDPQEMNDAKNMLDYQRQHMGEFFADDVIDWIDGNDPIGMLIYANEQGWDEETKDALRDYINAKMVYEGMMQGVRDGIDEQIAASDAMIDGRINGSTGHIHPATMKVDDRKVYVVGGRFALNDDGTIDKDNTDESLIIRDAETGKLEYTDPNAILSGEEAVDPTEERANAAETIRQEYAQRAANNIDGVLTITVGNSYPVTDGNGQVVEATLMGHALDEDGTAIPDSYILQMPDGSTAVFNYDQLQAMTEAANLERLNQFEQERQAERQAQREAEREAARPQYNYGDEFTLDVEGNLIRGSVTAAMNEDGLIEVHTEEPINGNKVNLFTRAELDAMLHEQSRSIADVDTNLTPTDNEVQPEETPTDTNTVGSLATPTDVQAEPQAQAEPEAAPTEVQPQPIEPQMSALSQIPKDENGKPNFAGAETAELGWDALVEKTQGDEGMAKTFADNMVSNKEKALAKAEKAKPKAIDDIDNFIKSENQRKAAIEQAKAELEAWKRIAAVKENRQHEADRMREEEMRRKAEEARIREAKEKAEREEAERIEREALEGVPDWAHDTPANARKRGYRRFNGQKIDRQQPTAQDDKGFGKEVEPMFRAGDKPVSAKGRVFIANVEDFQPSHLDGKQNPAHFGDEWQPKKRHEDGGVSGHNADANARNLRPELVTRFEDAFSGAPIVNARREGIQGNNRLQMLRYLYERYPEHAKAYKQYLIDHAADYGVDPDYIRSLERPIVTMMLDVTDDEANRYGNIDDKEMTSGGKEELRPKNIVERLGGEKMKTFANILLRSTDDEASFSELVTKNGFDALSYLSQMGVISDTVFATALDSKGNLTDQAAAGLKGVMYQSIFTGASTQTEEYFYKMPAKAQRAILATAFRDFDSAFKDRMIREIQQSIIAFNALMADATFRDAKNIKDAKLAVQAWKQQYAFDDVSGNPYLPAEKFSNFALELAAMYKGQTQSFIQSTFNQMYDIIQGKQEETLLTLMNGEEVDKTPKSLAEAIEQVLHIEYQPIKGKESTDGRNGDAVVDSNSEESEGGRPGSSGAVDSGERTEGGEQSAVSGTGTESDSGQGSEVNPNRRGHKQIERAKRDLASAMAEGDVKAVSIAIANFRYNVNKGAEATAEETTLFDNAIAWLAEQGYEYVEQTGKPYHPGMQCDAEFITDESLPTGTQIIDSVVEPLLLKDGKMVQRPKYVVRQSVYEDKEAEERDKAAHNIKRSDILVSKRTGKLFYVANVGDGKFYLRSEDSANPKTQKEIDESFRLATEEEIKASEWATQIRKEIAEQEIQANQTSADPIQDEVEEMMREREPQLVEDAIKGDAEAYRRLRNKIQREFKIGYNRAGRIVDGIINKHGGNASTQAAVKTSTEGNHTDSAENLSQNSPENLLTSKQLSYDEKKGKWNGIPEGEEIIGPANNRFAKGEKIWWPKNAPSIVELRHGAYGTYAAVLVDDPNAESPTDMMEILEGDGYIIDMDGGTRFVKFDTYQEAVDFAHHLDDVVKQAAEMREERRRIKEEEEHVTLDDFDTIFPSPTEESTEAEAKTEHHGGDHVELLDGTSGDILLAHHADGETTYTLTDGRKIKESDIATPNAEAPATEQPTKEAPTEKPATEDKPKVNPSGNKLVTDERYAELKARLRKKFGGQLNMGVDPEIMAIGAEMAVYHIEKGARKFAAYVKAMVADLAELADQIPYQYLKGFYKNAHSMLEYEAPEIADEMDSDTDVNAADVASIVSGHVDAMATAELVNQEQEAEKEREIAERKMKAYKDFIKSSAKMVAEDRGLQRAVADKNAVMIENHGIQAFEDRFTEIFTDDIIFGEDYKLVNDEYEADYKGLRDKIIKEAVRMIEKGIVKPKAATASLKKLIEQYRAMKEKHPDALLLFRYGNNYVALQDDAKFAAEKLNLTTTTAKDNGETIVKAAFPIKELEANLPKLIRGGKRVAVCEPLEEPEKKPKPTPKPAETKPTPKPTPKPAENKPVPKPSTTGSLFDFEDEEQPTEGGIDILNPTDEQIEAAVDQMEANNDEGAILALDIVGYSNPALAGTTKAKAKEQLLRTLAKVSDKTIQKALSDKDLSDEVKQLLQAELEKRGIMQAEAPEVNLPEEKPAEELAGDSAQHQEREKQTAALVKEIGAAIMDRALEMGVDPSKRGLIMADVKKMAAKYDTLRDIRDTDLQELVELAMTNLTRQVAQRCINGSSMAQENGFNIIVSYYKAQPSLNARDSERQIKQQYSTPTPFGYVMGQFVQAHGKQIESFLEPSAGNGALTIGINPEVCHVNDIDDARLANLRKLGFGLVTAQDALLPFQGEPVDAMMTNPPFGTIGEKVYDGIFNITSLEGQMAINGLESMKDDGRAAIVIGGNTSYRTNGSMNPKDAKFFGYLYSHYNVVDVINISGKALYSRNGTGYDVRMILIDGRKTGEFKRVIPPVRAKARAEQVTTFEELYNRVQDDIHRISTMGHPTADVQSESRPTTDGNSGAPVRESGNRPNSGTGQRPVSTGEVSGNTPKPTTSKPTATNNGGSTERPGQQSRPSGVDNGNGGNAGSTDNVPRPTNQRPASGNGSRTNDQGASGTDGRADTTPKPQRSTERLAVKPDLNTEKVPYPNQSDNGFTLMSVVPAAQAQVLQKSLGEIGDVDAYLVDRLGYSSKEELYGYLASEQIDSVALAIHQMENGHAFIIGDMTGVGKGRQGAALIRYAVQNGQIPIYFTQKAALFTDNYRDLNDIGSSNLRPFIIASNAKDANIVDTEGNVIHRLPSKAEQERVFKYIMENGKLPDEYDYVLTTYDQIRNGTADYEKQGNGAWSEKQRKLPAKSKGYTAADRNGQTRRDALARLVEGNVAILDESHTVGGDSGSGRYMQMLTDRAKGVTFLSATFAKRADNMPIYAQRTAISEADVTQQELIDAIAKGGVTLQEIMSKQLVESGQMIRRERSFEGVTIDWMSVDEETDRKQRQQFNEVAGIFNAIRAFQDTYIKPIIDQKNEDAAESGGTVGVTRGTEAMGVRNVPFASKMYNLVNQLLFALKSEAVADRVIWNLQHGFKPVISFTNTMEGFLNEAPKGEEMDEVPNFAITLLRALDGVMRYTELDADENSEGGVIPLSDLPQGGQDAYNEIKKRIEELSADLPISPMDAIRHRIEDAGYSVGEITGRTVQLSKTESGKYVVETRKDRDKKAAMRDFNSGKLDVLMINKSGSTGISLHASSKFEDQRQRVMVFAQFQSDINDEVQMRGRIDRTGQVCRGRYEYIMSTIPAEQRIQMMFKAKLKSLDANTTSSQKSKFNEMEIVDYLNKYGDEVVWAYMQEHPELEERLGDPLKMQRTDRGDGQRSTETVNTSNKVGCAGMISRYLAFLSVEEQDAIFADITEAYRVKMQLLNDAGENDLEITTMPLRAETISRKIWHEGSNPGSGNAFADHTYVEEVEVDVLKKPMKRAEIDKTIRQLMGEYYSEKNGGVNVEGYVRRLGDEIQAYYVAKADETIAKMKESAEKKVAKERDKAIKAALKAREKGENTFSDADITRIGEQVADETAREEVLKQEQRRASIMGTYLRISKLMTTLRAGQTYVVPQNLKEGNDGMFEQSFGTFLGFKFNKSYTLGSSTAIFATLDGRRKVELPLSDPAIDRILNSTSIAYRYSPKEVEAHKLENWDNNVPTLTRQKRYIITGNLLQALVDVTKGVSLGGNLISYSTMDGETRQGILMGENFKLTQLQNSAPISSRLTQIQSGDTVVSENGDVSIEKISTGWRNRGDYKLSVPKSKAKGGIFTMNQELLSLVQGRNFETKGNNMVAFISPENLARVLDILSRAPLNVRVLQESQLKDTEKNGNFAEESAVEYETSEGKTVTYASERKLDAYTPSLFDFDFSGDSETSQSDNVPTRPKRVQRETNPLLRRYGNRLKKKEGEFCHVERVFTESKRFDFTAGNEIHGPEDVAFIFSQLENAGVEHSYAVFVKDGQPTVVELCMGTYTATMVNTPAVIEAYRRIKPDTVYFVHNHPSGNLIYSKPDINVLRVIEKALGRKVEGIIVNLRTGKFGTFDTSGHSETRDKRTPSEVNPLTVYTFDQQVFADDYDPSALETMRSSMDVAAFIQSHRLGGRDKISMLVANQANKIVANVHTPYTSLTDKKLVDAIVHNINTFGGMSVFVYGSGISSKGFYELQKRVQEASDNMFRVMDAVRIEGEHTGEYKSAGDGNVFEPGEEYGAENDDLFRIREGEAPKERLKVYKLMRLGEDGKLYPLFIDAAAPTELKVWYDADSPNLDMLRDKKPGIYVVDGRTGKVITRAQFNAEHPELATTTKLPSIEAINYATDNGLRWMFIEETERAQKRFNGENRKYWNLGINGSGKVSTFSMRPGWHAASLPTMRQIGKGPNKDLRDDRFVWVEGYVSADIDYNEEAAKNPDKDMPDRIPVDGYYMKATNADAAKSQADRVGWYVAGAFMADRIISDAEAREIIDKFNAAHPDMKPVEYDYKRESGKDFEPSMTPEQRMSDYVRELADKLHLDNVDIVEDASTLKGKRAKAKGFYTRSTGRITIVLSNNHSAEDVERTLLHEAVAHFGLRKMFGKAFTTFLDNVYESASPAIRKKIAALAKAHNWDFHTATEEYLASLAEDTNFEEAQKESGWWSKVKQLFKEMLSSIGLEGFADNKVKLGNNELRYILWASYQNLKGSNDFGGMENAVMQDRLLSEEETQQSDIERDDLFRDGDFSPRDKAIARRAYNSMCESGSFQFREATQDSMAGLKALYQAILGKKTKIEDVAGFENAYLYENRMSSANAGEQYEYFLRYMKPLIKAIGALTGKSKRERDMLTDYMMAKHGLERNEYMRNEAAANGEDTDRDFAGLCGLTRMADWRDAEAEAKQIVDGYESTHDMALIDELWEKTNAATKASLEKIYLSGILSTETYEKIRDMYKYYIPLRGWDETTSDEVYGYLTSHDGPLMGNIMKSAHGRKSKADDPIATIGMMADAAIRQGNRNVMKQRFLNFVLNHQSDAVSIKDLWFAYDDVADEWVPQFADLTPDMTAEEVEAELEKFEAKIEALAKAEPDKYKRGREAANIPYKVVKGNLREHQVLIKRGGRTYVVTINGNPRAAQALNGLTNPDVETNGVIGNMLKAGEWVNRQLSAFYTTRNPDFVVSNFLRDMLYANCMTWVKENPRYALRFHKNFGMVNPVVMRRLLGKWINDQLNMGNPMEKAFYDFMRNGGETGYTSVKDIEGHKKTVSQELKKQGSVGRQAWHALGMQLELLNRSAENCARFAAFLTSREFGRSIDRAIYDAKEVSVNFNKKGSGGKMVNAVGQNWAGKLGSYLGGFGRAGYVFWNAGIQGMTNFGRNAKNHPLKFTAGAAALFSLGYVIPILAQMLGGGDGDDDDKNAYYNLPEYVRRSNICFKAGDQWIAIPLPIEYRSIYGLGELMYGVVSGNERYSDSELAFHAASQVSQILPLDMLEGGGGVHAFIPSAAKPFTEAYIMNEGWTGMPVYKDTPFNKADPEWTKAYQSADQHLVAFSRWLNEVSGGDDFKKGLIDINPAKIEYLLNGTFGGMFTFPNKLKKSGETAFGSREFEWRNIPIANRVIKSGDERTANRKLQNEYFKYKDEYEATGKLARKYENAADDGVMGYAEKVDLLYNSPEYLRYEIFDEFKPEIDAYREEIAAESDPRVRKQIEAEMWQMMRELINALHDPDKYFSEDEAPK